MGDNMKRSKKAALFLMAPITTLMLAGCAEQPVDTYVFDNPEECTAASLPSAQCKKDYAEAKALHPTVAPKYADKQACEADFGVGKCETASTGADSSPSFFMPMMMGYMMGKMFSPGGNTGAGVISQPLYKSRDDSRTFRTASNAPVSSHTGLTSIRPSKVQPTTGSLVRRGGFGSQAATRLMMGG
jgi:uncharacterized protein YgiB involved in biofilm formation